MKLRSGQLPLDSPILTQETILSSSKNQPYAVRRFALRSGGGTPGNPASQAQSPLSACGQEAAAGLGAREPAAARMRAPLGHLGEGEGREEGVRLRLLVGRSPVTWQGRRRRYRARGEGGREEGRSEGRKAGKGGRKRTRGREVPVLEVLGALPAPEVGREGGASPFLLPGEVPAPRGGSGPSLFSFSLRIDVLLLTREEEAVAAAAEDGVSESVNSAPLLGSGTGR